MLATLVRNWWAITLSGAMAFLFGVVALAWPGKTLVALIVCFAIFAIVAGLSTMVASARAARQHEHWGELLVDGLLGVTAGIVALVWPALTAKGLLYVVAAWAILHGATQLAAAVRLRRLIPGEWALGSSGLLSIIVGLLLFAWPRAGALSLAWLIGIYAMLSGFVLVTLGFQLRRTSLRREVPA